MVVVSLGQPDTLKERTEVAEVLTHQAPIPVGQGPPHFPSLSLFPPSAPLPACSRLEAEVGGHEWQLAGRARGVTTGVGG